MAIVFLLISLSLESFSFSLSFFFSLFFVIGPQKWKVGLTVDSVSSFSFQPFLLYSFKVLEFFHSQFLFLQGHFWDAALIVSFCSFLYSYLPTFFLSFYFSWSSLWNFFVFFLFFSFLWYHFSLS
jgi:hypothetical protein